MARFGRRATNLIAGAALFAFGALAAFPQSTHAAENEAVINDQGVKKITVTGSVEKAAVDDSGKVIAVEIWTESNGAADYYLVDDDPKGSELLPLVGKKVEIAGTVEEDEDDNKILTVQSYTVLK